MKVMTELLSVADTTPCQEAAPPPLKGHNFMSLKSIPALKEYNILLMAIDP